MEARSSYFRRSRRSHRNRWLFSDVALAAALLGLLGTGCSGGTDRSGAEPAPSTTDVNAAPSTTPDERSDTETSEPPELEVLSAEDTGFYDVPSPIPAGRHGDLIRLQPIPGAPEGVTWQRMMYLSESVDGEPTVVTGVLTLPASEAPPGGWPLFAHAHGSTGMADDCAPSVSLSAGRRYSAEIQLLSAWVPARGIAVVSTDYEGLGGPGRHPMLVGVSEGRSVLDSVLAARQVPGVAFEDRVGIIGYSQGGHASAWANQIAPDWTPDLDIVGVLAGAPATELFGLIETQGEGAALMLAAALAAADPSLDLTSVLTENGMAAVDQLDRTCEDAPPPAGPLTKVDLTKTQPWSELIRANEPGSSAGAAPVLIIHSKEDRNVPVELSAAFEKRLCAAGGVVERRVLGSGNHVAAAIPAYEQGIDWILGLESGARPASTCR